MDKSKYRKYLLSIEWSKIRQLLFKERGYKCERCNTKKKLQVHHIHYDNVFNEKLEDLLILCPKCHQKEHKIIKKQKKKNVKPPKVKYSFFIMTIKNEYNLKKNNPVKYKAYKKWLKKRLR